MFNLTCSLALKDLWHDKKVSFCVSAALVAVMAPLLLLFGLKHGVITQLQHELEQKPDLLEIRTQGNSHRLGLDWLEQVKNRSDVRFAIGLTRSLNTEAQVFKTKNAAQHTIKEHFYSEIIPTAKGDPLLKEASTRIDQQNIAVSYKLAQQLNLQLHQPVFFKLSRTTEGKKINSIFSANVIHILAPHEFSRAAAFMPVESLLGIEYFIDGLQPSFQPITPIPVTHQFANVRLYANTMHDVLALSDWLEQQHIPTFSQQSAIHSTLAINSVLNLIFTVIALTTLLGGTVSLIGSFLVNIDRKRYLIATLRLLGFNQKNIMHYVSIQVFLITSSSYLVAILLYFMGSTVFNYFLGKNAQTSSFSSYLSLQQLFMAFFITCLLSFLVAVIGAKQSMNIDPAESLREI